MLNDLENKQLTYKLIDLFSGAGGMTLGFESSDFCGGFETVAAIDNDRSSVATYNMNFGGSAFVEDVEKWVSGGVIPPADIVVGGPPCQGFSLLNKNRKTDKRKELWEPFMDVVELSGSTMFVMENVAELLKSLELQRILKRANTLGFDTKQAILNTADFGAPQTRKRTIVIGWKRGWFSTKPEFPIPSHYDPRKGEVEGLMPWVTVRDRISGLPKIPKGTEIGASKVLGLHFGRNPTELSKKRYALIPPGGNRFDLQRKAPELTPNCWLNKPSGGTDLFGRLWWDRPSVTIRTEFFKPEKGRYLHPKENRPITHREAARLMGFPDEFKFTGSKTEIARQIGNAVPPQLSGALAKSVRFALDVAEKRMADGKKIKAA